MNNKQDNQPSNDEGLDELLSAWHEDVDRRAKAARFQVLAEAQPPRADNRQNTREHQRNSRSCNLPTTPFVTCLMQPSLH